jgi:hypothetical protein
LDRRVWRTATDFTKGVYMLSTASVAKLVESIVEVVHDFWGDDPRFALFIERVKAIPASR